MKYRNRKDYTPGQIAAGWALIAFWFTAIIGSVAAWFVHVVTCLSTGQIGFLIAGAIFFPIGIIHGWGIILGVW